MEELVDYRVRDDRSVPAGVYRYVHEAAVFHGVSAVSDAGGGELVEKIEPEPRHVVHQKLAYHTFGQ